MENNCQKNSSSVLQKVLNVIYSCQTTEHFKTAERYVELYKKYSPLDFDIAVEIFNYRKNLLLEGIRND